MKEEQRVCGDCGAVIEEHDDGAIVDSNGWHCGDCAEETAEETVASLAGKYNDVSSKIKVLEKEKETLRAALVRRMGDEVEVTDGHYKVNRTVVFANRFDSTAFKKENAELAEKYTVKSSSERLTVELAF
jgi:ribosomal protein S27AE